MEILFDQSGLQAHRHCIDQARLSTLLDQLRGLEMVTRVVFASPPLSASSLGDSSLLIITTRQSGYEDSELDDLETFVSGGGSLFLLSNHGACPPLRNHFDWTEHDARLAERFGVTLEPAWFAASEGRRLTTFSGDDLNGSHPIVMGGGAGSTVERVVTKNCCGVRAGSGETVVSLSTEMRDWRHAPLPVDGLSFAVAVDRDGGGGRVLIMGDSGFLGSPDTLKGLLGEPDNAQFVTNSVQWLLGVI